MKLTSRSSNMISRMKLVKVDLELSIQDNTVGCLSLLKLFWGFPLQKMLQPLLRKFNFSSRILTYRFLIESSKLKHTHIVQFLGAVVDNNAPLMVMELMSTKYNEYLVFSFFS
jgi:hypothetical protein